MKFVVLWFSPTLTHKEKIYNWQPGSRGSRFAETRHHNANGIVKTLCSLVIGKFDECLVGKLQIRDKKTTRAQKYIDRTTLAAGCFDGVQPIYDS